MFKLENRLYSLGSMFPGDGNELVTEPTLFPFKRISAAYMMPHPQRMFSTPVTIRNPASWTCVTWRGDQTFILRQGSMGGTARNTFYSASCPRHLHFRPPYIVVSSSTAVRRVRHRISTFFLSQRSIPPRVHTHRVHYSASSLLRMLHLYARG